MSSPPARKVHIVLSWLCRLVLGVLFIYAGFTKVYPPEHRFMFEMTLSTYQLLPDWGVIVVARVLPWLEMALGATLIAGWIQRTIATFTTLLLGFFIGAMALTYSRGIEANCGCFGFGEAISPFTLTRDSLLLLMAVFLAVQAWRAQPAGAPQPE